MAALAILMLFLAGTCIAQQQNSSPARIPQVTIEGAKKGIACPTDELLRQARNRTKEAVLAILHERFPEDHQSQCPCGGPGEWRRIAHLDMSDPNQQCPSNWRLVTSPVRACGRPAAGCYSTIYPAGGRPFSRVCGKLIAYQFGGGEAFWSAVFNNRGLEDPYVDGVSLTHGAAGSRQHIWTFAAAIYETDPNYANGLKWVCPCTNTNFDWFSRFVIPSFIGNNYFCDSANRGPGFSSSATYPDDPLWDGEGCGSTSTCCQFNAPPWFCTALPQPTSSDLELRICSNEPNNLEDTPISLLDIYVM